MDRRRITKFHVITKTISQIVTIVLEVGGIGLLIAFIFNHFSPTEDIAEHISRFFIGASVYEILIFFTLTQINDIRKDSILALITAYKYAELYCESDNPVIKENLQAGIDKQLAGQTLNDAETRNEYQQLMKILIKKDTIFIKQRLIHYEHCYELESLKWRYSLLLRLRK